jgi:hypothetical protein
MKNSKEINVNEEEQLSLDKLKDTSGGNSADHRYMMDIKICGDCRDCVSTFKCFPLLQARFSPISPPGLEGIRFLEFHGCCHCDGCYDHNWCTKGAIY